VCSGSSEKFYSCCDNGNARILTCHLLYTQLSIYNNCTTSFSNILFYDAILRKSFNGLNTACRLPTGSPDPDPYDRHKGYITYSEGFSLNKY